MTDDEACTRSGCGHGPHGDYCEAEVRSEGEPDGVACGCPDYTPRACRHCGRELYPGTARHGVLAGTSGPDDSPEPEYVCLDADGEQIEPVLVVPDPWSTMGPVPPPPF